MASEALLVDEPRSGSGALSGWLVVLWHGAGGDVTERSLAAVARAASEGGALVVRARFPYRLAGKRAPDRMPVLLGAAKEGLDRALALPSAAGRRVALGGRSMGGRVASMMVADGVPADALVFLSYPLHPAGQPAKLRDAHLDRVSCPMLFVEGDRDPLCDLALLRPVLARLGSRARLTVFAGGDHSLRRVPDAEITGAVTGFLASAGRSDPS